MHPEQYNSFMERDVYIDEWMGHVKQYILAKQGSLITDRKLLFVVESQCFKTVTMPSRELTVMVGSVPSYMHVATIMHEHVNLNLFQHIPFEGKIIYCIETYFRSCTMVLGRLYAGSLLLMVLSSAMILSYNILNKSCC